MNVFEEDMNYIIDKTLSLEKLKGGTVLVTGSTGLIGSAIIKTLLHASERKALNLRMIAFARNLNKAKSIFEGYNVVLFQGDIREKIRIPEKLDYIIHCAALTRSKEMVNYPAESLLTIIEGTKNILDLAREKNVKSVVTLSSMEMYGTHARHMGTDIRRDEDEMVTENMLGYIDLANPRSSYPEGKRAADCLCFAYQKEYGVPVKVARLAQTFGAGVTKEESRIFAQFAESAMQGKDILLHTDGSSEGNYVYLADAICGILIILLRGQDGEAYNVANEKLHMTIKQMAETVAKEVAKGKIKVVTDTAKDASEYGYAPPTKLYLNSDKLRALGWEPEYGMKDMYIRMIAYLSEHRQNEY